MRKLIRLPYLDGKYKAGEGEMGLAESEPLLPALIIRLSPVMSCFMI